MKWRTILNRQSFDSLTIDNHWLDSRSPPLRNREPHLAPMNHAVVKPRPSACTIGFFGDGDRRRKIGFTEGKILELTPFKVFDGKNSIGSLLSGPRRVEWWYCLPPIPAAVGWLLSEEVVVVEVVSIKQRERERERETAVMVVVFVGCGGGVGRKSRCWWPESVIYTHTQRDRKTLIWDWDLIL